MKTTANKTISYLYIAAILSFYSCTTETNTPLEAEQVNVVTSPLSNGIYEISNIQFKSAQMQLGKLEKRTFHEVVKTNGMFDVPPSNKVSVSPYFGGTVKDFQLLPGEKVKKGQVLFTLENPEYIKLQQDFLEAKGQLKYLQSDFERQKNLAKDNVVSQKKYLKAESDYTVTKVKMESLSKKLELLNIDPTTLKIENIRTQVSITSPINGFITQVEISRGTFINPTEAALTIVNTEHMHLELNIYEKDLPKVRIDQPINFRIQQDNSNTYEAYVHLINKSVNSENRTIGVHGHLKDEKLSKTFTPGMYVEAEILTSTTTQAALPQNAAIEIDGSYFVLVLEKTSDNGYSFLKKEVKIGQSTEGYVEILNSQDFSDTTQFLLKGGFNLLSE